MSNDEGWPLFFKSLGILLGPFVIAFIACNKWGTVKLIKDVIDNFDTSGPLAGAIRILIWIGLLALILSVVGKPMMNIYHDLPEVLQILAICIFVVALEMSLWLAAIGPLQFLNLCEKNPKSAKNDFRTALLISGVMPAICFVVYLSARVFGALI